MQNLNNKRGGLQTSGLAAHEASQRKDYYEAMKSFLTIASLTLLLLWPIVICYGIQMIMDLL